MLKDSKDNLIKVSVIIPVFNVENYLEYCLESVLGQTFKEIEIICIDAGSTDSSVDILKKYSRKDVRVRFISQEYSDCGIAVAKNKGVSLAAGEYILFLEPYDFLEKEAIREAYDSAVQNDADICLFAYNSPDTADHWDDGDHLTDETESLPLSAVFSNDDVRDIAFNMGSYTVCNKLFRKKFINEKEITFRQVFSCEDIAFVMSAISCAERMTFNNKKLIHHRINVKKCMTTGIEYRWKDSYDVLSALKEYLISEKKYELFKKSFVNLALDVFMEKISSLGDIFGGHLKHFLLREGFEKLDIQENSDNNFYNGKNREKYKEMVIEYKELCRVSDTDDKSQSVSVIIPAIGIFSERNLICCAESILNQSFRKIEVIIVSDNPEISQKGYFVHDSRLSFKSVGGTGYGMIMDRILKSLRSEYIVFADPDDFLDVDFLIRIMREIKNYPCDAVLSEKAIFKHDLYGNLKYINKEKCAGDPETAEKTVFTFVPEDNDDLWDGIYGLEGVVFRRSMIAKELSLTEFKDISDTNCLFLNRLMLFSKCVLKINDFLYYRRDLKKRIKGCNIGKDSDSPFSDHIEPSILRNIVKMHMENILSEKHESPKEYIFYSSEIFSDIKKCKIYKPGDMPVEYVSDFNRIVSDPASFYYRNNNKKQISFIIPEDCLDGDVKGLLEMLRMQDLDGYEVLTAVSGSETAERLEYLTEAFDEFKIKNAHGLAYDETIDSVISDAQGAYIMFVNPDTLMGKGILKKIISLCVKNGSDIYLLSNFVNGYTFKLPRENLFDANDLNGLCDMETVYELWGKLFRLEFIKAFDISFDCDFVRKAVSLSDVISISDAVHYYQKTDWFENREMNVPVLTGSSIVVRYYMDDASDCSPLYNIFMFGNPTVLCKLSELGFDKSNKKFLGWKIFRRYDNSWYVRSDSGEMSWVQAVNGILPPGTEYVLHKDGLILSKPVEYGEIHLVAVWE